MKEELRFRKSYLISAPTEQVWAALTDKDSVARWHLCVPSELEPRVGGTVRFNTGGTAVIVGKVTAFEPMRTFGHTFSFTSEPYDPPSRVIFTLEPAPNGCKLTVDHSGFQEMNATYRDAFACWPILMCGLQSLFEERAAHPQAA